MREDKKILKVTLVLLIFYMLAVSVSAKVILPNLLTDNAVLQRNSNHKLWGIAKPNTDVVISASWSSKTVTTTADEEGNWLTYIETPDAGGPYTITFDDGEITKLTNILIGEVWVLSGQSNMFMKIKGNPSSNIFVLNREEILANADNDNLRLYTVLSGQLSKTPIDEVAGKWRVSDSANADNFSAVGFQFGQMLQEALQIPVGILVSAWSGSFIRAWISEEYLSEFPEMMIDTDEELGGNSPTVLYNSMLYPLRNYTFKGALWYQGSSDLYNNTIYEKLLQRMVQNWRETFDVTPEEFPFYLAQNHPYFWKGDLTNRNAAFLRETQVKASYSIPNAGYIVTLDVGEKHDIHPPDKTTVARRYANLALAKTYGVNDVVYQYPEYIEKRIEESKVILKFKNVKAGIKPNPDLYKGFEIAGEDRMYFPATSATVINTNEIEVYSEDVTAPIAVRYAFTNYSDAYIFNSEDMPAPSFRTDELLTSSGEDAPGVISAWNFDSRDNNSSAGTGELQPAGGEIAVNTEGYENIKIAGNRVFLDKL